MAMSKKALDLWKTLHYIELAQPICFNQIRLMFILHIFANCDIKQKPLEHFNKHEFKLTLHR